MSAFNPMSTFENNIKNTWGKIGENWLLKLPSIIEVLAKQWSLVEIKAVDNMNLNYVALATQEGKTPVVLKISCDQALILDEYKALKYFNGQGSIGVIDINVEYNALLLEQALPGTLLKQYNAINTSGTISIYTDVVKQLAKIPLSDENFKHVSQWCNAIDEITDQRIDARLIGKSQQIKSFLLGSVEHEYVCHGDLHLENIIQHETNWLAIDPKGIIGEIAFEAAAFDLINKKELRDVPNLPAKIIERVSCLANALDVNFNRLLAWIFLRLIISAQWFIEDNGDPSEQITLANSIYPLIEKINTKP